MHVSTPLLRPRALLLVALLVGALFAGNAAPAEAAGYRATVDLTFPVAGPNRFMRDFDHCRSGCSRKHRATDIMVEKYGQPVHAAVGGTISWITGLDGPPPSYGYMITIRGDDGRNYDYVHLGRQDGRPGQAYTRGMARGVRVERGQHIGYAGCSGNASCSAPHLHFMIEDPHVTDPYGSHYIDPYDSLLAAQERGDVAGTTGAGTTMSFSRGVPVAGDWDGDGEAGIGWYIEGSVRLERSDGEIIAFDYGRPGDVPIVGDWDGDGVDTVSIIRDRVWHINNRHAGGRSAQSFVYGRLTAGDLPVPGDWNGDGHDTVGIIRDGEWHLRDDLSGGPGTHRFTYGRVSRGDIPLVGDWNGDDRDEVAVVRDATWYLRSVLAAGPGDEVFEFGAPGELPVVGDWTGAGVDLPGRVRQGAEWHLLHGFVSGQADEVREFLP